MPLQANPLRRIVDTDSLGRQAAQQRAGGFPVYRVHPIRRDIRQRRKDESPQMRAWVRQDRIRRLPDQAVDPDKIQIERSRGILRAAGPP